MYNDGFLALDDIAQIDPEQASTVAYLLGNGQAKQRMDRNAYMTNRSRWLLMLMSTGEITFAQHIGILGRKVHGGQRVRFFDVPADADAGLGLFEDIHAAKDANTFAKELGQASLLYYGTPIRAFLRELVERKDELKAKAQRVRDRFLTERVPADASGEVQRAAKRFAMVAAAGELILFGHHRLEC